MNALAQEVYYTKDDYLAMESHSPYKHEYLDGQIYAMAGATGEYDTIAGNLYVAFSLHLKGKSCRPFGNDIRIAVEQGFFYPDVSVDCGYDSQQPFFAGEPVIIVEVLSNSTRRFDLGEKFKRYRGVPSLAEFVVIEQDFMRVDIYRKNANWSATRYEKGDKVIFESIGLTLPIEEIYERIDFIENVLSFPIIKAKR